MWEIKSIKNLHNKRKVEQKISLALNKKRNILSLTVQIKFSITEI